MITWISTCCQIETAMPGHARDAFADDRQRVLGQVDQDRPRLRARRTCPGRRVPVATLRARSSPSQVFEHFGAPPITPTDEAPHSCSTSQRWACSSLGISPTRTTGSGWLTFDGHLQTLAFFLDAGRGRVG